MNGTTGVLCRATRRRMTRIIACACLAVAAFGVEASEPIRDVIEIEGMRVTSSRSASGVEFELVAETSGWVAIGVNERDAIVGSDLFMAAVQNGRGVAEHHIVTGPGVHPRAEELDRRSAIVASNVRFDESGRTTAHLVLDPDLVSGERLEAGVDVFLIAAWSIAPEFDHHSRVRRHVRVRL